MKHHMKSRSTCISVNQSLLARTVNLALSSSLVVRLLTNSLILLRLVVVLYSQTVCDNLSLASSITLTLELLGNWELTLKVSDPVQLEALTLCDWRH